MKKAWASFSVPCMLNSHVTVENFKTYRKVVYENCQHAVSVYQHVTHTITMVPYKIISPEHMYIYIYIYICEYTYIQYV